MRLAYETSEPAVPVGDRGLMPSCVAASVIEAPHDWPSISFRLAVEHRTLCLECVDIERPEGGHPVTYGVMREVLARLPGLVRQAVTYWLSEDVGDGLFADPSPEVVASVLGDVARRRTQPTGDRLARALALMDEGGITAVVDGLDVSRAHAYRLVKRARQELGDATR
jgi:hypothetical protein